jgi:hypothetical protein
VAAATSTSSATATPAVMPDLFVVASCIAHNPLSSGGWLDL